MKSITKKLWFNTKKPREFINITGEVDSLLRESGIQEGLCLFRAVFSLIGIILSRSWRQLQG